MSFRFRILFLSSILGGLLLLLSVHPGGAGSARQAEQKKAVWEVTVAANTRARSDIKVRNNCEREHTFTVEPHDLPYIQLPAPPTITVPGRVVQNMPVTFDTTGMRPGQYEGYLRVKCETCRYDRGCHQDNERLAVRLTVTPAAAAQRPPPGPAPDTLPPRRRPDTLPQVMESESASCRDAKCRTNIAVLSTGYDHFMGQPYQALAADTYWEVLDAPNSRPLDLHGRPNFPGKSTTLTLPGPATVLAPQPGTFMPANAPYAHPQWTLLNGSHWISSGDYSFAAQTINPKPAKKNDPYYPPWTFQKCFCTCGGVEKILLDFKLLTANSAEITFDGTPIGSMPSETEANYRQGLQIRREFRVNPGRHCLRVDLRRSRYEPAMGINVNGAAKSVPAGRPIFLTEACCNPRGRIGGKKFNDLNCNGNLDAQPGVEPGLQGWAINLKNTATGETRTATTDANGMYNFEQLAPGTYTLGEDMQAGWSQSLPGGGGAYTFTLPRPNEHLTRNFGNCRLPGPCGAVAAQEVSCSSPGWYQYRVTVTNNSPNDVYRVLLTPSNNGASGNFTQSLYDLPSPLRSGESTTLNVNFGRTPAGTIFCFYATLMSKAGTCCSIEICPALSNC
jgi:hypothetical protein